ncbi:MAG: tetratricopeptide repeat protein [Proteobacteria bacterium]|nr:tetratricopeptide repeat protein [Pseudomonadota bacterium]
MTEENTIKKGSSVDELSERISGLGVVNHDMASFIAHNWQKIVWAIGIAILVTIVYYQYLGTQQKRSFDAAQRFESAQNQFKELIASVETKKDDTKDNVLKAINDNVGLIKTTHSDLEYANLAKLYQASAYLQATQYDKVKEALSSFKYERLLNVSSPKTSKEVEKNELTDELAALMFIRTLIAENKTDAKQLKANLTSLLNASKYVTVEAAVLFYRTATTNEDRIEVEKIIKQLTAARVELKGVIENLLSQEDITISE